MIVQPASFDFKHRNQVGRECLYAWYPEVVNDSHRSQRETARDIYIHKGIDRSLLNDTSSMNQTMISDASDNGHDEVYRRYKQSMATSERIYQSTETVEDALKTPWALHFDVEHRAATPNLGSHANDLANEEKPVRRLKSAPLLRTLPPKPVLTVPEPQFTTPIIPPSTPTPTTSVSQPKTRASSARARLNTTLPTTNEQLQEITRRSIKSATVSRSPEEVNRIDQQERPSTTKQQESSSMTSPASRQEQRPVIELKFSRSQAQLTSLPPNPYYIHRPGVVSANNLDKKSLVRATSASRKAHRRHHRSSNSEKQRGPLLAITPTSQSQRSPIQMNGIYLIYDSTLTLDDSSSSSLKKYFIDGNLYLIKDQRYNVIENFNPSYLEQHQQSFGLPPRPKYYQTIPIENLQIPKPASDIHYNASETFFYNTMPKRIHRYVIDPNFISENLNVNKISLNERAPSANLAISSTNQQTQRSSTARPRTVHG